MRKKGPLRKLLISSTPIALLLIFFNFESSLRQRSSSTIRTVVFLATVKNKKNKT